MWNRRRLVRERLEVYLVHLILRYQHPIFIGGLLLLVYGIVVMFTNLLAGNAIVLPAIYLLLLSSSYNVVLYSARLGAWLVTIWSRDD